MSEAPAATREDNRGLFLRLVVIAAAMFAFGYALVPFYDKICRVTGLRDIARPDEVRNTQVDATRTVRVELDANTRGLPWRFRPLETAIDVHPGAVNQVEFEIVNETGRPVIGQAIPSYAPRSAGRYFRKLDCFCFTTQTLAPGERRRMPVVFVLDGELPADTHTITLSYTFFEVENAAAAAKGSAATGS
ncbi:MAG: cytochrome c oxidase assembly protein [Burkholderiales bacterium]|nr:cytochrome c oxidase assembly protein [Burkholderiales bacterium]MCE7877673.1 cytochrome c oxidase assembly protein [Betaproteobacteria bacterium PRO3]